MNRDMRAATLCIVLSMLLGGCASLACHTQAMSVHFKVMHGARSLYAL